MDDINTVYALLVLIMFFVLLSRLDNRFGKIERELNEIKKRMDDYLKVQQRGVTEKVKPEGEALKKENEDISASPQIIEKTSTLETKQQKETVPEKQKPVVETVIREALEGTREKTVETELEDVCVEAVPKQKKQVNYEKFIGENLFGKIGILIFVIGVGFFVKYAIDKNWINETFRTVLGFKKWGELPMISFVFTWLIMGIFLLFSYTSSSTVISGHLFLFTTLFYFIFLLPVFSILRGEDMRTMSRGLVFVIITNNFIYLLSGALFLRNMGWSFKASGLLSLFIALVNLGLVLWLWKSRKDYKFLVYTTLGLVLTFVSITVPIQLDGNYITLVWASEMVLLLWLYIKSRIRVYEYAAKILVGLTFISYLMDIYNVVMHEHHAVSTIFLNSSFATSLFVGLAMGAFALLMGYYRPFFSTARQLKYGFWNPFMLFVSVAILYYTFMMEFHLHFEGATRSGAMFLFTAIAISSVCYAFRKRFPITQCLTFYMLAIGINTLVYIINIWGDQWENMAFVPVVLRWFTAAFVIANICYVARQYYLLIGIKSRFTIYLNILVTLLWVTMVRSFLWQVGVDDFSAGLSLSLSIAGFVQMGLGMRLHQKVMRMISLSTFGIVLLKLVFDDLWAMPTIGKIIVFIILGLILLILSFLYQKLKDVLFKNDEDEVS